MVIEHIAHSEFRILLECGITIVTDPYNDSCGYPIVPVNADYVLVSHQHHDHNAVENIGGHPAVIDSVSVHTLQTGVKVTAIQASHDKSEGAERGKTLLFLIEAEGLRVVHLGDIGCILSEEQIKILQNADILMVPVGGYFTVDEKEAMIIADQCNAKVIIPMHYKTYYNKDWPISPVELFLKNCGTEYEAAPVLRVTAGDIECLPRIMVLDRALS